MHKTIVMGFFCWSFAATALADPAGELLDQIVGLNKMKFEGYEGYLFQNWLQFDENDLTYVVYIGDRKYDTKIDDGRGTTERAKQCRKDNPFAENPMTGCAVSFDGQYIIDDKSGSIEVSTIIWNLLFK